MQQEEEKKNQEELETEDQEESIVLSDDQVKAVEGILEWIKPASELGYSSILTLGGYAGTGKTTVLSTVREELGNDLQVGFMAFTGKATAVMNRKLHESKVLRWGDQCSTIHSYMYKPVTDSKGNIIDWTWKPMAREGDDFSFDTAPHVDMFIIDEASMLPKELLDDLEEYGVPILAVGDHGQLPPVKGDSNLMVSPNLRLEHIHRQAEDNPILTWAHMARRGERIPFGEIAPNVCKITRADYGGSYAEIAITATPSSEHMTLVGTNKLRVAINTAVLRLHREDKSEDPLPRAGERVMCLRNNRKSGIYNGMAGVVKELRTCYHYPDHNISFQFAPDDYEGEYLINLDVAKYGFLSEYAKIPDDVEYSKVGQLFDYGYAMTVHKAQGSEADKVVVFGEGFKWWKDDLNARWLYTAITRAKKELYLVV